MHVLEAWFIVVSCHVYRIKIARRPLLGYLMKIAASHFLGSPIIGFANISVTIYKHVDGVDLGQQDCSVCKGYF